MIWFYSIVLMISCFHELFMICVAISKGLSQFITSLIAIIFRVQPLFALLSGALLLPQTPVVFVTPQTHKITKEIHITIYTSSSRCTCSASKTVSMILSTFLGWLSFREHLRIHTLTRKLSHPQNTEMIENPCKVLWLLYLDCPYVCGGPWLSRWTAWFQTLLCNQCHYKHAKWPKQCRNHDDTTSLGVNAMLLRPETWATLDFGGSRTSS